MIETANTLNEQARPILQPEGVGFTGRTAVEGALPSLQELVTVVPGQGAVSWSDVLNYLERGGESVSAGSCSGCGGCGGCDARPRQALAAPVVRSITTVESL